MKWNEIKITLSSVWVQKVSGAMGIPNKATSLFFSFILLRLLLLLLFFLLLWWKQPTTTYMVCFYLTFFFRILFSFKLCGRPHVILQNVNKNCPQVVENFEHTCMFEWLCRKRNGTFKWIEKEAKRVSLKRRKSIQRWYNGKRVKKNMTQLNLKKETKKLYRENCSNFFFSFYISCG